MLWKIVLRYALALQETLFIDQAAPYTCVQQT